MDRLKGRSGLHKLRQDYNNTLMEVLDGRLGHFYLNTDHAMGDTAFFGSDNTLNSYGCAEFWTEVDKQIEKFEARKINLKPFPHKMHKPQQQPRSTTPSTPNDSGIKNIRSSKIGRLMLVEDPETLNFNIYLGNMCQNSLSFTIVFYFNRC